MALVRSSPKIILVMDIQMEDQGVNVHNETPYGVLGTEALN